MMKTGSLTSLCRHVYELVRPTIERGDALCPMLIEIRRDRDGTTDVAVCFIGDRMSNEAGKEALSAALPTLVSAPGTVAVILVSECWLSSQEGVAPSEAPDAKEAVIAVVIRPNENSTMARFDILRNPDRLLWQDPESGEGVLLMGRFTVNAGPPRPLH